MDGNPANFREVPDLSANIGPNNKIRYFNGQHLHNVALGVPALFQEAFTRESSE